MKKDNRFFIWEGDRWMMYLGHPGRSDSQRIDVTMAVKLGMSIESKDYDSFKAETVEQ